MFLTLSANILRIETFDSALILLKRLVSYLFFKNRSTSAMSACAGCNSGRSTISRARWTIYLLTKPIDFASQIDAFDFAFEHSEMLGKGSRSEAPRKERCSHTRNGPRKTRVRSGNRREKPL